MRSEDRPERSVRTPGLGGWLLERLGRRTLPKPRLKLIERIALAPRQSLALVEADGRRFLVGSSSEGAPSFLALDATVRPSDLREAPVARAATHPDRHTGRRSARSRAARVPC